jgi:hypothetical protein
MRETMPAVPAYNREDDEDQALLRLCMRPEEDLLEYRRRVPWKGEYRFFRSRNVVCLEHYKRPVAFAGTIDVSRPKGGLSYLKRPPNPRRLADGATAVPREEPDSEP